MNSTTLNDKELITKKRLMTNSIINVYTKVITIVIFYRKTP